MELVILAWAPEMQILAVVQIEHWFPASSERPQEFPRRELPGMATGLLVREDIREGRRRTSGRGHPDRGCRSSRHDQILQVVLSLSIGGGQCQLATTMETKII
ncbi:hypothetical protein PVAP13_9NG381200 [Panicum virgatum]|uniref:Uncharacterized protein n=1 Tax=Panicum virgatum TaxID=38727 RepID=A0A8T0MSL0_PANVG|nr:hypothetical protein PVAP13_9NG381200 [Panicum virgatum]